MAESFDSKTQVQSTRLQNLTESLLASAVDLSKPSKNEQARLTPPTTVTEEEFTTQLTRFEERTPGYCIFDTPSEDMRTAEVPLDLKHGSLGTYRVKTMTSNSYCSQCGRRNNFLDVVNTAVKGNTHSAAFLKKVFLGEFGYVSNKNLHQRCECYQCGRELPLESTKFLKPVPCEAFDPPGYIFPYVHTF